jgi:3'(2'), 5'-bisphosphate nucleotidase
MNPKPLLQFVIDLAKHAGEKILEFYHHDHLAIKIKSDNSPVTEADIVAHQTIVAGLQQLTPELPVLSEESAMIPFAQRQQWQCYWLIDPIDGTKEFIDHTDDFAISIALVEAHKPILGIVYAPALKICYFACEGAGAFKQSADQTPQSIHTASWQNASYRIATSRRHGIDKLQKFLQQIKDFSVIQRGSALKCGLVAEGAADVYPRLSPTSEWDIAAGQCIIEQAGGAVINTHGNPLQYNTKESLLNPAFLAVGDKSFNWLQYLK